MDDYFKDQSVWIRIYRGKETVIDPYEKNVEITLLSPLPVRALVRDLTSSQIHWKMFGIKTDNAKEIIIEKKHRSLLERSQKIEINREFFKGWRENGRLQIREEGNYIRCYIYSKHI